MMTCVLGGNPEQISLFNFFPNCRNGVTFEKIPSLPNQAWTLDWMTKSNFESWGTVAKCICIISFITVWIFEEMTFQARKLWLNFPHKSSFEYDYFPFYSFPIRSHVFFSEDEEEFIRQDTQRAPLFRESKMWKKVPFSTLVRRNLKAW